MLNKSTVFENIYMNYEVKYFKWKISIPSDPSYQF